MIVHCLRERGFCVSALVIRYKREARMVLGENVAVVVGYAQRSVKTASGGSLRGRRGKRERDWNFEQRDEKDIVRDAQKKGESLVDSAG